MASRTIKMKNAREVIRLKSLNNSLRKIDKISKVSRTSIRYILEKSKESKFSFSKLISLNDLDLKEILYPNKNSSDPRYLRLASEIPQILSSLGENKENLLHQWELYRAFDPHGYSYSQFCHHIFKEQTKDAPGVAVFQYTFGDILFVDYA